MHSSQILAKLNNQFLGLSGTKLVQRKVFENQKDIDEFELAFNFKLKTEEILLSGVLQSLYYTGHSSATNAERRHLEQAIVSHNKQGLALIVDRNLTLKLLGLGKIAYTTFDKKDGQYHLYKKSPRLAIAPSEKTPQQANSDDVNVKIEIKSKPLYSTAASSSKSDNKKESVIDSDKKERVIDTDKKESLFPVGNPNEDWADL
ncbi:MAG: hypothetical protein KAS12_01700 [Candidatus Aenigmarchaeota archaeon]|nr:hypothetical protein [Candidatus Aenigmarchaeota archaeon]